MMSGFRFKTNNMISNLIIFISIMQVMILKWLGLTGIFNKIIIAIIIFYYLTEGKKYFKVSFMVTTLAYIFIFVLNFAILGGDFYIFTKNLYRVIAPIFIIYFFVGLAKHRKKYLRNVLKKLFVPFNYFMILNIPILILQMNGNTSISGVYEQANTFLPDLISGLFGYNGTHLLGLFSITFFLYNYTYFKVWLKKHKKFFVVYNIFFAIFLLFVSMKNDNKTFFVLLPVFLTYFMLIKYHAILKGRLSKLFSKGKLLLKIMGYGVVLCGAFLIALQIPSIRTVFDELIFSIDWGWKASSQATGGFTRIGMISYFLSKTNILWFGNGIGNYEWNQVAFGFRYFGQSNFGEFLLIGGATLIISQFMIICYLYLVLFKGKFLVFLITFLYIVLSIYTVILTEMSATVSVVLFLIISYVFSEELVK